MKDIQYLLIIFFFPVLLFAQNTSYYYYKGKKQTLEIDKNYLFISTDRSDLAQRSSNNAVNGASFKRERINGKNIYWAELKIEKQLSDQEYNEYVKQLKKDRNVKIVAPYFKSQTGEKVEYMFNV